LFCVRPIAEEEGKTPARSIDKISRRGSLSLNLSKCKARKEIEGDHIIIYEFPTTKNTMTGTMTPIDIKARVVILPYLGVKY
jgi:hypothetical protein